MYESGQFTTEIAFCLVCANHDDWSGVFSNNYGMLVCIATSLLLQRVWLPDVAAWPW